MSTELNRLLATFEQSVKTVAEQLRAQTAANSVPIFTGSRPDCEQWVRSLDIVYGIVKSDTITIETAFLKSSGMVSESLKSWALQTPNDQKTWANCKVAIEKTFGYPRDEKSSLALLRNTKQEKDMSILWYYKLIDIRAPYAFPGADISSAAIQKQLTEIFINGLQSDFIKRKLVINNVTTLDAAAKLAQDQTVVSTRLSAFGLLDSTNDKRRETPMEVDSITYHTPSQTQYPSIPTQHPSHYTDPMTPCTYPPFDQPYYETNDIPPTPDPLYQPPPDDTGPQDDMNAYHEHLDENIYQHDTPIPSHTIPGETLETEQDVYAMHTSPRKCYICDSVSHLFRQCPVRTQRFAAPQQYQRYTHRPQQQYTARPQFNHFQYTPNRYSYPRFSQQHISAPHRQPRPHFSTSNLSGPTQNNTRPPYPSHPRPTSNFRHQRPSQQNSQKKTDFRSSRA